MSLLPKQSQFPGIRDRASGWHWEKGCGQREPIQATVKIRMLTKRSVMIPLEHWFLLFLKQKYIKGKNSSTRLCQKQAQQVNHKSFHLVAHRLDWRIGSNCQLYIQYPTPGPCVAVSSQSLPFTGPSTDYCTLCSTINLWPSDMSLYPDFTS